MKIKENIQREYWDNQNNRREPDHPIIEAFSLPKINHLNNFINFSSSKKLLDIGCGNGYFSYYFSKRAETVGLDFSQKMLVQNPCKNLVQGTALSLPFKDNSFDIVFCSNLLHHIENPQDVIHEMKRVSTNYIVILEPNRNNPLMAIFSIIIPEERMALKFSLEYMNTLIDRCGLTIINSCSMGSIVPNKTPQLLLPLLKIIDIKSPFGFYNIIISKKSED
jgi:SAM-dependent methyltransferase